MPSPASRPTTYLDRPYTPGDPIPAPIAVEKDGDSAWALFSELSKEQERRFADTAPAALPVPPPVVDAGYAQTAPMGLPTTPDEPPERAPATLPRVGLDLAMVEARRNNRVCPRPEYWQLLYEQLPNRRLVNGKHQPPPPITGPAWHATPALPKRLCFREHLEWAEQHGALDAMFEAMRCLPENAWLHMGED